MTTRQGAAKVAGVTFRCGRCFRSLGRHAPALLILERVEGPQRWSIHQMATWGQRWNQDPSRRRILPGQTPDRYEGWGTKLHIACRRCRHKPRPSAATLCAEADRAVTDGRDYTLV